MRRIALGLLMLAALGTGAACGGDSGPPLSADEFVRQANAICKASVPLAATRSVTAGRRVATCRTSSALTSLSSA